MKSLWQSPRHGPKAGSGGKQGNDVEIVHRGQRRNRARLTQSFFPVRRPLHGHRTEAGAGRCRSAGPRRDQTRAADLVEARHAARARMARGHPYGPHPCRRDRVARSALPLPLRGRAKDHWRPLVRPAVFWPQAAAARLLLKRKSGPWPGLITRKPLSPVLRLWRPLALSKNCKGASSRQRGADSDCE
jgi:hypothetical protein